MAPWVSFDGKNCGGCKHLNDRGYCEFTACIIPCTIRITVPEIKPQTNADRIRSMTDDELAVWIAARVDCGECKIYSRDCMASAVTCACQWRDWLKQEAR